MIAAAGLQCGFGDPLGPVLLELRELGFTIIRLDLQNADQAQTASLAQEVLTVGLQPLCIIRRAEQMLALPQGALIELGNEPDLEHFGWTVEEYLDVANQCVSIAVEHNLRLYLGAVSNLNARGFNFLRKLPWATWPSEMICCSIHRYPDGNSPLNPHTGWASREAEVETLRSIVGNRPLACTEVGYHDNKWTEDEVANHMTWERQFFSQQGFEICSGYQINDGPDDDQADNHYGFRRRDGAWKPVAFAFPHAVDPPLLTTTLKIGDYFVCAERGGGSYVIADRPGAGPWETWGVVVHDDGRVSFQAHNGQFLCAELDGSVVANRVQANEWERFELEVRDTNRCAFKTAHGTYLQAPGGGGPNRPLVHVLGPNMPGEWEFFTSSTEFWDAPFPVCKRPLIGPLRVEAKLFRDDTGLRRIFFCSWFTALRTLRDDPTEFYRQLDALTAAGFQGFRVFLTVGGWMDFWDGREVVPRTFTKWYWTGNFLRTDRYGTTLEAWPDYDDLLRELLRACRARKLRLHVTMGDLQIISPNPNDEIDLARRCARICAEEGGLDVIGFVESTNEFPLNRFASQADISITQMGRVLDVWTATIPGVLTCMGAIPGNEEVTSLELASTHGPVCAVHVTRDPVETCLKHTLGLVYFEGDYRAFPKPFLQGEPAGPGKDSYQRQDDPGVLTALYAFHMLTGQASNYFNGPAVRSDEPLESTFGFTELPALFDQFIPEDIATWDHGSNNRGGILYWWKGNDFLTAVFEDWDPSPPRPVASWTLYSGTTIIAGTGAPPTPSRYTGAPRGTGLLVGRFA